MGNEQIVGHSRASRGLTMSAPRGRPHWACRCECGAAQRLSTEQEKKSDPHALTRPVWAGQGRRGRLPHSTTNRHNDRVRVLCWVRPCKARCVSAWGDIKRERGTSVGENRTKKQTQETKEGGSSNHQKREGGWEKKKERERGKNEREEEERERERERAPLPAAVRCVHRRVTWPVTRARGEGGGG